MDKVLVLSCGTGGGHNSAARAIVDRLNKDNCKAVFSEYLDIVNPKMTNIIINTAKPGVVIGHGGDEIEKLKKEISKLVSENIQISIKEIKNPDLDAALVAENIARQIEGRVSFRIAQKRAIRNTMKAGAKGIKTSVSGRLGGADMARTEGYTDGIIPLHTLRADIDYAHKEANTTYGKIGVKVWICKGEILPAKNKGGNKDGRNTKKN